MVDMVVPRTEMKDTISNILSILMKRESTAPAADGEVDEAKSAETASEAAADAPTAQAAEKVAAEEKPAKAKKDTTGDGAIDIKPATA